MPRDYRMSVSDMLEAISRVEGYTQGHTFDSVFKDPMQGGVPIPRIGRIRQLGLLVLVERRQERQLGE
mgnify:CR=1 FL=1